MDASRNVLNIFVEAAYKIRAVGTVKRGSGRVPNKYMKSLFSLLVLAMVSRISPLSDFSSVPRGINYRRGCSNFCTSRSISEFSCRTKMFGILGVRVSLKSEY